MVWECGVHSVELLKPNVAREASSVRPVHAGDGGGLRLGSNFLDLFGHARIARDSVHEFQPARFLRVHAFSSHTDGFARVGIMFDELDSSCAASTQG